jgi:hypothetical protein
MEVGDDVAGLDKGGDAGFDGATVTVSAFDSVSLPIVMRRAIVLADGIR